MVGLVGSVGAAGLVGLTRPSSSYTSAASALFAAMTTPPTAARANLINTTIQNLQNAGLWALIDSLYVLAAADSQAALLDWKRPTRVATLVNSPTPTADRGFLTNGTTSEIDTNYNPATDGVGYTRDSASFFIWCRSTTQVGSSVAGWFDGTNGTTLQPRSASDFANGRVNQASSTGNTVSVTDGSGLYTMSRTDSIQSTLYRNDVSNGTVARASAAVVSNTFRLGRFSATGYGARQFAAAGAGAGLSAGDVANLYAILGGYMTAV